MLIRTIIDPDLLIIEEKYPKRIDPNDIQKACVDHFTFLFENRFSENIKVLIPDETYGKIISNLFTETCPAFQEQWQITINELLSTELINHVSIEPIENKDFLPNNLFSEWVEEKIIDEYICLLGDSFIFWGDEIVKRNKKDKRRFLTWKPTEQKSIQVFDYSGVENSSDGRIIGEYDIFCSPPQDDSKIDDFENWPKNIAIMIYDFARDKLQISELEIQKRKFEFLPKCLDDLNKEDRLPSRTGIIKTAALLMYRNGKGLRQIPNSKFGAIELYLDDDERLFYRLKKDKEKKVSVYQFTRYTMYHSHA